MSDKLSITELRALVSLTYEVSGNGELYKIRNAAPALLEIAEAAMARESAMIDYEIWGPADGRSFDDLREKARSTRDGLRAALGKVRP